MVIHLMENNSSLPHYYRIPNWNQFRFPSAASPNRKPEGAALYRSALAAAVAALCELQFFPTLLSPKTRTDKLEMACPCPCTGAPYPSYPYRPQARLRIHLRSAPSSSHIPEDAAFDRAAVVPAAPSPSRLGLHKFPRRRETQRNSNHRN
jgi:hypothetical protein